MKASHRLPLFLSTLASAPILLAQEMPNIVFFLVDDMGIGDISVYGQRYIHTPNLENLAKEGMVFTQAYAGCTVSAPSRGSLLTGKHTGHSYIRGNKDTPNPDGHVYDRALKADEVTLGELMKKAGYATACIGKWGLGGPGTEGAPNAQGFDYFYGYLGQLNAHDHRPPFLHENGKEIKLDGKVYAQDLFVEKALKYLDERKKENKPFFLYFTPALPHADLDIDEEDRQVYEGKFLEKPSDGAGYKPVEKPLSTYAAMVSRIDKDVQRLLDKLQANGQLENTIFIFSSDNGTHKEGGHDPYFFDGNGPYRGTKRDLYEGGVRTPFIVQWHGVVKPGSISYHIAAFWDIFPTFAELTGQKVPADTDGISILPTLTGKGEQKEHRYLYWEFEEEGGKQAVRVGDWKLIKLDINNPEKTRFELYNIAADPGELNNVAGQHPRLVAKYSEYIPAAHTPWKE